MIESIKSESELIFVLKTFVDLDDKNLLILRFSEKDLNKINSIHYVIDSFEKENKKLEEKLIILIVHKQRILKKNNLNQVEPPELISFFNDEYDQIFIDNLHGKENLDIFKIMQKDNDIVAEQYIYNADFIKNKIFIVLNYLNYNILYETKELNKKNYRAKLTELIINDEFLQNQIITNLKVQGKTVNNTIQKIFLSDSLEINDIDFIEVISTKLSSIFCECLLKIIFKSLTDSVLNPFIINKDINTLLKNNFFNNLVTSYFEKPQNVNKKLRMNINANNVTIYNGLKIPRSKQIFNELIKYFDEEISERYIKNEDILRKGYKEDKKIFAKETEYKKNLEKYTNNLKIQISKHNFFKELFNSNNKEILYEEYLVFFVIKYIEEKNIKPEMNERLVIFLKQLIKIKLNTIENENYENIVQDPSDEFVNIFIFTQGYKNDIKELFDIYLEVGVFCPNIEERMNNYLDEKNIKYEESSRNKRYTRTVNIALFNILESFIRIILIYSQELIQNDKEKFMKYFNLFPLIETSLQKLNKKYFLFSKEIYNIRNIIKIKEAYKSIPEELINNYKKIMDNLLLQSTLYYGENFIKLYDCILNLISIFEENFKEKNEEYTNLLFFIFRQEYKNIYKEDIRIQLLEKFFNNKLLLKHSKIFLVETMKNFKPDPKDKLTPNFLNIEKDDKFKKIKNILNSCNTINSPELNEILLYFFEGQCQSYFSDILKKNNDLYSEGCCKEILLGFSLDYLKHAMQYLYEFKNNEDRNNVLKIYAIAYIKTYFYYYVHIHKNYFDKVT